MSLNIFKKYIYLNWIFHDCATGEFLKNILVYLFNSYNEWIYLQDIIFRFSNSDITLL